MQITLFGASGKVGSLVLAGALEKGYRVVAFTHSKNLEINHPNLVTVQGDIYNNQSVTEAIKGSDVVISTLGSWGTPKKDILSSAMANIVPAMESMGIKRVISLTGAAAKTSTDKFRLIDNLNRSLLKLVSSKVLKDGEIHINLLEKSQLDWTIVRSPVMNNSGNPSKYKLIIKSSLPWQTINRKSVADAMIKLIDDQNFLKTAPFIVRD